MTRMAIFLAVLCLLVVRTAIADDSIVDRAGNGIKKGGEAAASGIEKGVDAAKSGIKKGVRETEKGVKKGSEWVGHGLKKAGEKLEKEGKS
jgi:hypothetical protein